MTNQLPSQERLNELYDYSVITGKLYRKSAGQGIKPSSIGKEVGSEFIYTMVNVDGNVWGAHRLIWKMVTGEDPLDRDVDHIDKDKNNNSWLNLRLGTRSQNNVNSGPQKDNKAGYKGVCPNPRSKRNPFTAYIQKDFKTYYLGSFKDAESAAIAYNNKALELFGEFAYLNTINSKNDKSTKDR